MFTKTQINNTKDSVSILDYLSSKGFEPENQIGRQYVYMSPITGETGTPSFFVDCQNNVFCDFSGGADPENNENKGDLIRLIQIMERCSFIKAMNIAQNLPGGNQQTRISQSRAASTKKENYTYIKRITSLYSYPLKNYLNERAIPFNIALRYLSEIHYYNEAGDFYALGFKNDTGGFELRSSKYKGCIGNKDIRSLGNPDATKVVLFESFFDFLSWMPTEDRLKRNFVIVLNSLRMLNRLPDLSRFQAISIFFDNDEDGQKNADLISKRYWGKCENASKIYFPDYQDYNDYIISKRIGK